MATVTRKDLDIQFNLFCDAFGLPHPEPGRFPDHGQYYIENPTRGNYRVARISDTGTGSSDPFGSSSHTIAELHTMLYFANAVHERVIRPQPMLPAPYVVCRKHPTAWGEDHYTESGLFTTATAAELTARDLNETLTGDYRAMGIEYVTLTGDEYQAARHQGRVY